MGNPLVAFALVAEEYEKSGDPVKGLKPLFAPLLSGESGKPYDPEKFAREFRTSYGLEMTPFVANALAERLSQIGLLETTSTHGRVSHVVAHFEWAPERIEETQVEQTIHLFCRWARPKLDQVGRELSDTALEEAILTRLARPEFASIFTDEDAEKKNEKFKGLLGLGALDPSVKDGQYLDFLVADFVLIAAETAPEVFKAISQIAYGALVADAVAGLAVTGPVTQPDPPLRVVFDGPLLLDLLNLNTLEHRSYAEGLLEMVRKAGLLLAVFDHSIEEMRSTIRSTILAYQRKASFGPMAERFRTEPGHVLYATTVADTLETRVKELGFTVLPSRFYEEARYKKYFPEERVDQIRNSIGDLHEHVEARIRDALSVATVVRLKGEKKSAESIFQAGTIFITRNSLLAKRVLKALAVGRSEPDPRFTIATDGQLAGILWFVSGLMGSDLSRRRLIANCSSAVIPKQDVVNRIATVLGGLNDQLKDEFSALMTDKRASLCPMRMTAGNIDAIDDQQSLQILQAMKAELVAPIEDRARQAEAIAAEHLSELKRVSAEGKDAVNVLQDVVESTEQKRLRQQSYFNEQLIQLEFTLESTNKELVESERRRAHWRDDVAGKIERAERDLKDREDRARRTIHVVLALLAATASLFSIFFPEFDNVWFKIVLAIVYLASIKWVDGIIDRVASRLVVGLYKGQRSYISGLRSALPADS